VLAHRHRRIDARGAQRGNPARENAEERHHRRNDGECHRIVRLHAEEQALHQAESTIDESCQIVIVRHAERQLLLRPARHPVQRIARVLTLVSLLAAASFTSAAAQSELLSRTASIAGTVRDSVSGRAPGRTSVCTFFPVGRSYLESRCATVDTLGAYRLDSLPARRLRVSVQCQTVRGPTWKELAADSLGLTGNVVARRDWTVSVAGCDTRLVRRVSGIFRGHYTPGFESSKFVPCAADAWFIPADSLDAYSYDARRAWATLPKGLGERLAWPDAPRDSHGNPRYYVRWRGTVVGPGSFGHMGVSPFEFFVDSVLELRAPAAKDCR